MRYFQFTVEALKEPGSGCNSRESRASRQTRYAA